VSFYVDPKTRLLVLQYFGTILNLLESEANRPPVLAGYLHTTGPQFTSQYRAGVREFFKSDEVDAARIWDESVETVLQAPNAETTVPIRSVAECSKVQVELLISRG